MAKFTKASAKKFIKNAKITVYVSKRSEYNCSHAFIVFQEGEDKGWGLARQFRIEFQANNLTHAEDTFSDVSPYKLFDYGNVPFGGFYGGHLDVGHDLSFDSDWSEKLVVPQLVCSLLQEQIRNCNLHLVTECQLGGICEAIEKLGGTYTLVRRNHNDREILDIHSDEIKFGVGAEKVAQIRANLAARDAEVRAKRAAELGLSEEVA
jgi:hypothetical protein